MLERCKEFYFTILTERELYPLSAYKWTEESEGEHPIVSSLFTSSDPTELEYLKLERECLTELQNQFIPLLNEKIWTPDRGATLKDIINHFITHPPEDAALTEEKVFSEYIAPILKAFSAVNKKVAATEKKSPEFLTRSHHHQHAGFSDFLCELKSDDKYINIPLPIMQALKTGKNYIAEQLLLAANEPEALLCPANKSLVDCLLSDTFSREHEYEYDTNIEKNDKNLPHIKTFLRLVQKHRFNPMESRHPEEEINYNITMDLISSLMKGAETDLIKFILPFYLNHLQRISSNCEEKVEIKMSSAAVTNTHSTKKMFGFLSDLLIKQAAEDFSDETFIAMIEIFHNHPIGKEILEKNLKQLTLNAEKYFLFERVDQLKHYVDLYKIIITPEEKAESIIEKCRRRNYAHSFPEYSYVEYFEKYFQHLSIKVIDIKENIFFKSSQNILPRIECIIV